MKASSSQIALKETLFSPTSERGLWQTDSCSLSCSLAWWIVDAFALSFAFLGPPLCACVMLCCRRAVLEPCPSPRWLWARWSLCTGRCSPPWPRNGCTARLFSGPDASMCWGAAARTASLWTQPRCWIWRASTGASCPLSPPLGPGHLLWPSETSWWSWEAWMHSRARWPRWKCITLMRASGRGRRDWGKPPWGSPH